MLRGGFRALVRQPPLRCFAVACRAASTSASASGSAIMPLVAEEDRFGGLLVTMESLAAEPSAESFASSLAASLTGWKAAGKRGIWIAVPKSRTELMPVAIDQGFDLHHTEPDRIVLNSWIHDSDNMLP